MTVSSFEPVNNHTGNNSNCEFDFDFLIENENELVVTLKNKKENTVEQLILGVDYSINEIGSKNGSFITYPLPEKSSHDVLSNDESLSLALNLPIKQENEFENSATLKLDVLEWTFDYIVRILQILSRKADRSVRVPEGEKITPEELIQNIFTAEFNSKTHSKSAYQHLEDIKEMKTKIDSDMKKLDKELVDVLHKSGDEDISGIKNFMGEIFYKGENFLDYISSDFTNEISAKQDKLTAGKNIEIVDNIISSNVNGLPIGSMYSLNCTENYVPDGSLLANGAEYTSELFKDFFNNFLNGGLLETCTYEQYQQELDTYGFCNKFALNSTSEVQTTCSDDRFSIVLLEDFDYKNVNLRLEVFTGEDGNITGQWYNEADNSTTNIAYHGINLSGDTSVLQDGDIVYVSMNIVYTGVFKVPTAKQIDRYLIKKKDATETDVTWYNIYSDGWCEQGGYLTPDSTSAALTYTLPFKENEVPYVEVNEATTGSSSDTGGYGEVSAVTNITNVSCRLTTIKSRTLYWRAIGYIDLETYPLPRNFVVVANGSINQSQMDWSEWASGLNGKANADLSNCTKPYIVEVSDKSILPSWYRVWSDGWCEQGGEFIDTGDVVFLKEYASADYTININYLESTSTSTATISHLAPRRTTTGFKVTSSSQKKGWRASGYIS